MWKCVRGLRSSANLLKGDQSNGGCVVSSIINKDIDELSPQPNDKSKCSCGDESFKRSVFKRERKIRNEQQTLAQDSKKHYKTAYPQIGETIIVSSKSSSFILTDSQAKSTTNPGQSVVFRDGDKVSSGNFLSCRKCHKVYEDDLKCLCFSKTPNLSWLSRLGAKNPDIDNSSTSMTRGALLKHSRFKPLSSDYHSTYFGSSEDKLHPNNSLTTSQHFDSPQKFYDTSSSPCSFLPSYHAIKKTRKSDVEHGHALSSKESQSRPSSSYCLLKLPFLSYNLVRCKGFNRFSECWMNKSKTQFGKDDNKGQGSKGRGESEEAKDDSWRRYQTQQSLLEAIGWSSALLLGWFLAQCRIWRLCGEGRNSEHKRKGQRKRCIGGILTRLLYPGKNSHKILKVLPSQYHESNDGQQKKEEIRSTENGGRIALDLCNGGSEGYFSDGLNRLDELQEKSISNNCKYSQIKEISSETTRNHQRADIHPFNELKEESAIPMPWHAQESKEFGPITLEEAINEAGKSLEEAQAEILLILALEKLEEDESDVGASAVELLDSAAHLGSSAAAFNLGICYEMGVGGVTKDLTRAYYWYKMASDNGHAAATYNIAIFHAQGLAGLSVNTQLAHQLLERASSLGLPEATDALALLTSLKPTANFDGLEKDPAQKHRRYVSQSSNESLTDDEEIEASDEEIEASVSSSDFYFVNNASKPRDDSSLHTKSKDGRSTFSHMMESFRLPFPKLNENEGSHVDLLLDNTLSVSKSDFDCVSAITFAQ